MKTDKKGCSTCKKGEEQYSEFKKGAKTFIQYDYRTENGELFSCIDLSLENCRARRDKWQNSDNELCWLIIITTRASLDEFDESEYTTVIKQFPENQEQEAKNFMREYNFGGKRIIMVLGKTRIH